VLREIARDLGREEHHHPTEVAVFFGEPAKRVPDPFFGGKGPDRVGCTHCGACMTGCRVGAKNTLDRNYLYLAERLGVVVKAETEAKHVAPLAGGGYRVRAEPSIQGGRAEDITATNVIFAGGVMGTLPLLLEMKEDATGLPKLSDRLGDFVRTNSEALFGVVAPDDDDLTEGVAITSILHTDEHSHIEPVRYGRGSGFFRLLLSPHAPGPTALVRIATAAREMLGNPARWLRVLSLADFSRHSQVLLYMRTLEGTLKLRLGRSAMTGFRRGMVTQVDDPAGAPSAFIPEATDLAKRFARKVGGVTTTLITETLMGVPSTAHILGGACMGDSPETGVIDARHRVFGYDGLYVIDGAAVSANPGVNPSLTITALAERAMGFIPPKAA
jgi:cholesterol oxidase